MKIKYFLFVFSFFLCGIVHAQYDSFLYSMEGTDVWTIRKEVKEDTVMIVPITSQIYGFSVSGTVRLKNDNRALARIVVEDEYGVDYLVYEAYPLIVDSLESVFENIAIETKELSGIVLKKLKFFLIDAELYVEEVSYCKNQLLRTMQNQSMSEILEQRESFMIERINAQLEKNEASWRAGSTSFSKFTYEEKRWIFGGQVPNLGGFEYYKSGIFCMPGLEEKISKDESPCVSYWDWRDRHGKNWMSPVKNQLSCGACWAYGAVAAIEAYVNLYYNRLLNLDLSEQQLVSCVGSCNGCGGGFGHFALDYVEKEGIVEESCFPYENDSGSCTSICSDPSERIGIERSVFFKFENEDEMKQALIRTPLTAANSDWNHEVLMLGYKEIRVGDTIEMMRYGNGKTDKIVIQNNSPLVGHTAWLIKNSYGEDWGEQGFGWLVVPDWTKLSNSLAGVSGRIISLQYDDADIVVEDRDGDGYYFWGVGSKPENLPDWIPDEADGDDSDPNKGPLDEFGYELDLNPMNMDVLHIYTDTVFVGGHIRIYPDVHVENGGTLTIRGNIFLNRDTEIVVKNGGSLVIDGGVVNQADIHVKGGGKLMVINGGYLIRGEDDVLETDMDGQVIWEEGTVNNM